MGTAVSLRNIIGKAEYIFLVGIVPLHGHFHADAILVCNEMKNSLVKRGFILVQVFHERANTALIFEHILFVIAPVGEHNTHT